MIYRFIYRCSWIDTMYIKISGYNMHLGIYIHRRVHQYLSIFITYIHTVISGRCVSVNICMYTYSRCVWTLHYIICLVQACHVFVLSCPCMLYLLSFSFLFLFPFMFLFAFLYCLVLHVPVPYPVGYQHRANAAMCAPLRARANAVVIWVCA